MYDVYYEPSFKKNVKKILSSYELELLEKFILEILPYKADFVGDILSFRFLREIKIKGKRIYFLIYKRYNVILLVDASRKKEQKKVIKEIKNNLDYYMEFVLKLYNNSNL